MAALVAAQPQEAALRASIVLIAARGRVSSAVGPPIGDCEVSDQLLQVGETGTVVVGSGSLWKALHSGKRLSDAPPKLARRTVADGVG